MQTLQHVGKEGEAKSYYDQFVSKAGSNTQIAQIRKNEAELKNKFRQIQVATIR